MKIFLVMLVSAGLLFSLSKQKIFIEHQQQWSIAHRSRSASKVYSYLESSIPLSNPSFDELLSSLFFVFTGRSIFRGWDKLQWEFQQCFHHWWIRNDPSQRFQFSSSSVSTATESTTHVYRQFRWFLWQRRSLLSHIWQHHPHRSNPKAKRTLWSAASTTSSNYNSSSFFCTSAINCQAQLPQSSSLWNILL